MSPAAPRPSGAAVRHGAEILRQVLELRYPADAVLARYFRGHRNLGSGERSAIAEAVFDVLRRLRTTRALAGVDGDDASDARRLLLTAMARHPHMGPGALGYALEPGEEEWIREVAAAPRPSEPAALACDLPDWLHDRLVGRLGIDETAKLAEALARPAPLDVRVNPLRLPREEALERLREDGFRAEPCALSPVGIRLPDKPSLHSHPLYRDGGLEIQDEGSQLLALLVDARPGEMVCDFCAGAGGKTLLMGATMESKGRLYAFDVVANRLQRLRPRLQRSGLSNVVPTVLASDNDRKVKRLSDMLDRVLVDAPCTGLGTARRNPDLKWKHSPETAAELAAKQARILSSAARMVKRGGRLVYATCSFLREENEGVVDAFVGQRPEFRRVPVSEAAIHAGLRLHGHDGDLQLWPHRHDTDGFYAAILQRD